MFSYRSIKQFSSKLINSKKYGEIKLNFKNILTDIAVHKSNIKNRKADADVELVAKLYTDYMKKLDDVNLMRKQLNTMRRAISDGSKKGLDVTHLIKDSKKHSEDIDKFLLHLNKIENQLMTEALQIPNLTHPDSPVGGEEKAEVLKVVGKKRKNNFEP